MKNRFLEAGQIVNTHGIQGEVKIVPWCDSPEFLCRFDTLYLGERPVKVRSARIHKGNVLALAYNPANRWTSADYSGNRATENPNARFPRLSYGNNANNTKPSTFWKGNARYLRLQELSLNYNLHTPGLRKALGLQSIDFQIMCENLAVWDGVEIFDPEQAMQTGHAYPIPRRFSLQIYLNF